MFGRRLRRVRVGLTRGLRRVTSPLFRVVASLMLVLTSLPLSVLIGPPAAPPTAAAAGDLVWTTATLSQARTFLAATAAGGKALFAGGSTNAAGTAFSSAVDIFDGATSTWTTASLSQARGFFAATAVGNKAFFAGGSASAGTSNVVDIYDATAGTWSTATLSQAREDLVATTAGSKALFAGGNTAPTGTAFSNVVDIYDGTTDAWSTAALSQARGDFAATAVGNKALFAGGDTSSGNSNVVDIYDATTGVWSTAALSQARYVPTAAAVGGKALFAGGLRTGGAGLSNVVDIYDAATGAWTAATLTQARFALSATTVGNRVIFAGGDTTSGLSNVVDIYDAATGAWSTAALAEARRSLAATTVGNKALFGGGHDGSISNVVDIANMALAPAVSVVWTRQFGTAGVDGVSVVAASGGKVMVGGPVVNAAYPGQTAAGGYDGYVRVYDAGGNAEWTRQIGTAGDDAVAGVARDGAGNIYVTGETDGVLAQPDLGSRDAFLRKYDASGAVVWTQQFGSACYDTNWMIVLGSDGNLYLGGTCADGYAFPGETAAGGHDAVVRKYDPDGNVLWTRQFGSSANDWANALAADASGVYLAGETAGTFTGLTSAGGNDAYVRKYDLAGTLLWTRQFGSSGGDAVHDIALDADGSVLVTGQAGAALPGQTSAGLTDAYVRKYNASGTEQWTRQFGTSGTEGSNGVAADLSGNVFVAGHTNGTFAGQTSAGGSDIVVRKYSAAGAELWTHQLGGTADDNVGDAATDAAGNLYVGGQTSGTLPGQTAVGGATDAYVVKLSDLPPATRLAITDISPANPTAGQPFSVTVQAQDSTGAPANVAVATPVHLSVKTGTGTLAPAAPQGTIALGTSSITITGLTYSKAETGVVLRADDDATPNETTETGLTPGDSAAFTVMAPPDTTLNSGALVVADGMTLNTPSNASLNITGDITLESWVKWSALPGSQQGRQILGKWNEQDAQRSFMFTLAQCPCATPQANGQFQLQLRLFGDVADETLAVNISTPNIGRWQHYAVTWSAASKTATFYIDGVSQGTATGSNPAIKTSSARFGLGYTDVHGTAVGPVGMVDEVRVWNTLRTTPQIAADHGHQLAGTEPNLQLYWQFNGTYADSSPNGNNGTPTGNLAFTTDVPFGGPAASKLAITNISPASPTAGQPFSVTVQAQDGAGNPANVVAATQVTLSRKTGTGTLGGTLTGTIAVSTSSITITGVTYTPAEAGVVLRADDDAMPNETTETSLTPGDSAPFNVLSVDWVAQNSGVTNGLYSVDMVDANVGWAVGDNPGPAVILKTVNGGTSWQAQDGSATQGGGLLAISAADANTAWAVGINGSVVKTTNGGTSWVSQSNQVAQVCSGCEHFTGVAAVNTTTAWVISSAGRIIKTTDGGASWTLQRLGDGTDLAAITAVDANTAYAVGINAVGVGSLILKTVDGGATWVSQSVTTLDANLLGVSAADANTVYAVGSGGSIYKTSNGGTSWTNQNSGAGTPDLTGVTAVTATTAWAVGLNGSVRKTADGGSTWTAQSSGTTQTLRGVSMAGGSLWTVGDGGTILKTVLPVPTKLAITSISPTSPTAGQAFAVTVQAQDGTGAPANVTAAAVPVHLSVKTGTGTLTPAAPQGSIAQGTNSITITGLTYGKAETGVVLQADDDPTPNETTETGLLPGDSAPFAVLAPQAIAPPAGMVAWWPGDGNANDIRGTNHGTVSGEAIFPAGLVDQAFSFDGVDDRVVVSDHPSLNFVGDFSIEAWVNLQNPVAGHDDWIVAKIDSGIGHGYSLSLLRDTRQVQFHVDYGYSGPFLSQMPVALNNWAHIVVVREGSTGRIYLNGALDAATDVPTGPAASTHPLLIGAIYDSGLNPPVQSGHGFNGLIDEVSLYNRALDAAEVQAIFNAGSEGKNKQATAARLAITNITPTSPTVGQAFAVTVQAQDSTGAPADVAAATPVHLSVKTGTGALAPAAPQGSIAAWTSSITITGLTYSKAENGVELRADDDATPNETTETGLMPGDSAAFTVGVEPIFSVNLLKNPGNEAALVGGEIPNWTEVVGSTWTKRTSDPAPFEGQAYFFAGESASAELRQDVDVSAFAGTITAGTQRFAFESRVRSWPQSPADTSHTIVEYRSADNSAVLDSFDSGQIANTSAWQPVLDARIAPVGTRWVRVRLISIRNTGTNNDGYFDALTLSALPLPAKLAVTSVNPTSPTAGQAFSVTVQAQDSTGTPAVVAAATTVYLTRQTGTGVLGGTVTDTIAQGTSSVTITGLTYSKAETGVVLRADDDATPNETTETGLIPGDSIASMVAQVVYSNDFEGTVGTDWSSTTRDVTPVGARGFLGQFANQTASLSLGSLPSHAAVTVSFDLFTIRSWDGNDTLFGPDVWDLSVAGGPTLVHTTFSTAYPTQAYPGPYPDGSYPVRTGAAENNTLGYTYAYTDGTRPADSVYRLSFTFPHSASALTLNFSASGLQSLGDESWGLDNVVVGVTPAVPTKLAITTITPASPTAGLPFSVTVQAQDNTGAPANVAAATPVHLSVKTGTGTLAPAAPQGTIAQGTSSVTITGLTYSKAETGVVLRADDDATPNETTETGLIPGDSATFSVLSPCPEGPAGGGGLVGNASFDATVNPTVVLSPPLPQSAGSWTPAQGTGATVAQVSCDQPVHGGIHSASVQTIASGGFAYWYQDLQTLSNTTSYELSFWVYPDGGRQQADLLANWDRGAGSADFPTIVDLSPESTSLNGYGQVVSVAALTYKQWHHVRVVADSCVRTQQLYLDGTRVATTAPGTVPGGPVTLILGHTGSSVPANTRFLFDDVSVAFLASCPSGPTRLAITQVSPASPTVGQPFDVTVQAQDASGAPANVAAATTVHLTRQTGTGTLVGTLTGTIAVGTSAITITGVTYSKAENGVVLRADDDATPDESTETGLVPGDSAAVNVLEPCPAVATPGGGGLVGNPSFEDAAAAPDFTNVSTGNWRAYTVGATTALVPCPEPVHGGTKSAKVEATGGQGGGYWFQDFASFPANNSYEYSFWAHPDTGAQGMDLMLDWDRGAQGANTALSRVRINSAAVNLTGWGDTFVSTPAVSYNQWHHIRVVANTCSRTQQLFVDGTLAGTTPAATALPSMGTATILLGEGNSTAGASSRFFYDDVSLSVSGPCTTGTPHHLAITDINNSVSPIVGKAFSVTVQAQEAGGAPANVAAATSVHLTVKTGNGTLTGTLTGTISAGTNSVTISVGSYSVAESGVVLRADDDTTPSETTETGLLPGDSTTPFTIITGGCDVNSDTVIDPLDALRILRIYAGFVTPQYPGEGDVNGDGVTDPLDALRALRYYAGFIPTC